MGKKFNYCATESSYTDAKSSGEFTDEDLAFVKGNTAKGILKTRGMSIGTREIEFAGVFNYGTDYIEETNSIVAGAKLYFLSALGKFGYGTVTSYSSTQSPVVLFKFKGIVSGTLITSSKALFEDACCVEGGSLYPLDNAVYVVNDRKGIKYDIHEDGTGHFRAKPLFELKAGDCMLIDGTFCLSKDAAENHVDEIYGIIVDPTRKTMIDINGSGQVMQRSTFANTSASETVIKPIRNQLAGIDNCVDYDRVFANLVYAIGGYNSMFSSYFPVFYTVRFGTYSGKTSIWYLATDYEKLFIRDNEAIQEVLAAIGNGYALTPNSATPQYSYNDAAATMMGEKLYGATMPMYQSGSTSTYYNYLVVYV